MWLAKADRHDLAPTRLNVSLLASQLRDEHIWLKSRANRTDRTAISLALPR